MTLITFSVQCFTVETEEIKKKEEKGTVPAFEKGHDLTERMAMEALFSCLTALHLIYSIVTHRVFIDKNICGNMPHKNVTYQVINKASTCALSKEEKRKKSFRIMGFIFNFFTDIIWSELHVFNS